MTATLDQTVASVLFAARLLEKAVHDPGPWTLSYGPFEVPARRFEIDGGVVFLGVLPSHCYLVAPDPTLTLRCDGEIAAMRAIEHPGDGEAEIAWRVVGHLASVPV